MLKNLKIEMVKNDVSNQDIADMLNISVKSVRNKINEITQFTVSEAVTIRNKYFPNIPVEILFFKTN